jgi:dynein intermediate chain 1
MTVYSVRWNPFHPRVFLSCSADWSVRLWDHSRKYDRPVSIVCFGGLT